MFGVSLLWNGKARAGENIPRQTSKFEDVTESLAFQLRDLSREKPGYESLAAQVM